MSSRTGAIAAGHPRTVAAGMDILRQGGNAFDAAIAALAAAFTAEPLLTSPGGGGFLLAAPVGGEPRLYDFFAQTPLAGPDPTAEFYPVGVDFGPTTQEFHIGRGAIAVPGVLRGLVQAQQDLGSLPLAAVLGPAIALAREGLVVDPFQEVCFDLLAPICLASESARTLYAPTGRLPRQGECWANLDLAERLTQLGQEPETTLRAFDRELAALGGLVTAADCEAYRVEVRTPLRLPLGDWELLTNPLPSSGGVLIGRSLQMLTAPGAGMADLVRAFAHAESLRRHWLEAGEPSCACQENLLPPSFWGSTTHLSVVDGQGNAAALTSSTGEGCGWVLPGWGVMLNNMLGEADLNPRGFHRWAAGVRLSSMMAPTMLRQGGEPRLVLGTGGANRIRTAIAQVIWRWALQGLDLEEAIAAPRLHWEAGRLDWEPGWPEAELAGAIALSRESRDWPEPSLFFGGVHAIARRADGHLQAVGDPRRHGAAAVWRGG